MRIRRSLVRESAPGWACYPTPNVRRVRKFFAHLVALHGTPIGIAGGFTIGMGLSLVPIPFLGMLIALALVPILRLNPAATYLGTVVVNPFTGSVFYFVELSLGMGLLGQPMPSWAELRGLDVQAWWRLFLDLLLPFALGAAVLIATATALTFPSVLWATRWAQRFAANAAERRPR